MNFECDSCIKQEIKILYATELLKPRNFPKEFLYLLEFLIFKTGRSNNNCTVGSGHSFYFRNSLPKIFIML